MADTERRKEAFIVHAATYEQAVNELTYEQIGELFVKLGRFHFYGEDVSSDNKDIRILLNMAKPYMMSASQRYQEAIENGFKGKEYGNRGGRPRKGETREEYDARRLRRSSGIVGEPENPLKPLNTNINTNRNTDINKTTNIKDNINSVFTNSISSLESSNLVGDETKQGAKPSQKDRRQGGNESSNSQQDRTAQADELDTRFSNPVDLDGATESEPPIWIDIDPDDLPPLIDDGWTPPPAELQHNEVVLDDAPPAHVTSNSIDGKKVALEETIKREIQTLLDCDAEKKPMSLYRPAHGRAVKAAMDYFGCGEEKAKDYIKQLKAVF